MAKLSFEQWKKKVDAHIASYCGLSSDDLPDIDYMGMWDSGDSPKEAATEAIKYAMEN